MARRLPVVAIALLALLVSAPLVAVAQETPSLADKIKHVVVLMLENRSFVRAGGGDCSSMCGVLRTHYLPPVRAWACIAQDHMIGMLKGGFRCPPNVAPACEASAVPRLSHTYDAQARSRTSMGA